MKRSITLGGIVLAAVMMVATTTVLGQRAGGGFTFPPVGKPEKITDTLYWLQGQGGNTAIYVASDGVVLVDTKLANNGQAILDAVKSVTNKPVTHIINTHTHGDHTGSNQFFPASVDIVTQENTAEN